MKDLAWTWRLVVKNGWSLFKGLNRFLDLPVHCDPDFSSSDCQSVLVLSTYIVVLSPVGNRKLATNSSCLISRKYKTMISFLLSIYEWHQHYIQEDLFLSLTFVVLTIFTSRRPQNQSKIVKFHIGLSESNKSFTSTQASSLLVCLGRCWTLTGFQIH